VSWLASQPTVVSVISGVARVEQLTQNVAAAGWKITADDLAQIDRIVGQT
jgi:aryl-alcohol dehydrogenase-like predicted oxidoreductase